jgi:nucleobase:cation symporter-1, NCS1 family
MPSLLAPAPHFCPCVYTVLTTPQGDIPDTFGEESGTSTARFVAFFLFWLFSLPAIWFPVHQIRHLFTVKAYVVPVAGIAFLIWTIVKAGGIGPIVSQPSSASGSEWSWAFLKGIMSSIANFATLIVNDPGTTTPNSSFLAWTSLTRHLSVDFSRFAGKPKDAFWSQLITIPAGFAITSLIGILVSSASGIIYPEPEWDPIRVLDKFIDTGNSGERFAIFLLAFAFALAQLGTNIAANSVSAGTDMTALIPRYINIRRGGYVCAAVGLAMCPWQLLRSSNSFTTYLSAYSVFLSSIAGVMISDYYAVRKGYLIIEDLFSAKKDGAYYFTFGFHWRAYAAYIAGILINVVGFADAVGAKNIPMGAIYIYRVNFFSGFIVASSTYYLLCRFFPIPATSDKWMEVGQDLDEVTVAYGAGNNRTAYDEENAYNEKGRDGDETPPGEKRL